MEWVSGHIFLCAIVISIISPTFALFLPVFCNQHSPQYNLAYAVLSLTYKKYVCYSIHNTVKILKTQLSLETHKILFLYFKYKTSWCPLECRHTFCKTFFSEEASFFRGTSHRFYFSNSTDETTNTQVLCFSSSVMVLEQRSLRALGTINNIPTYVRTDRQTDCFRSE